MYYINPLIKFWYIFSYYIINEVENAGYLQLFNISLDSIVSQL